jgi:hypothetical protein
MESDDLRQENKILLSKVECRVPLSQADRRILAQYGLRTKDRLKLALRKALNSDEFCCSPPGFVLISVPCKVRKA